MVSCGSGCWLLTSPRLRVFSPCTTLSWIHEAMCRSWRCKQCKRVSFAVMINQALKACLGFFVVVSSGCFMLKHWLCVCDFPVWSCHVCCPQSSWNELSLSGLGHQWLSILWHKELASCCTCYARGVMFLSPWFTERSVYWRRFKIHYSLVLPRKTVEHSKAKAEVRAGKSRSWYFIDNFSCICVTLLDPSWIWD